MSIDVFINPTLATWWQFGIFILLISLILYWFFRKIFCILLSERLHPDRARKLGAMATWLVMGLAIAVNLIIHFVKNFGQPVLWFYDYLAPLTACLVFVILFFVTRTQLGEDKS